MAAATPPKIPSRFQPEREQHKFLKRFKASWVKRYRPTRMEEIFEAVDLATYLSALGRNDEAEALLAFVTDGAAFGGNFNVWTPMGCALVLLARLRRLGKDAAGARRALAPLIERSYRVPVEPGEPAACVAETAHKLEEAAGESQKWACLGISRHLMDLHFFRETAKRGFPHAGSYPTKPLDAAIAECMDRLKARLE